MRNIHSAYFTENMHEFLEKRQIKLRLAFSLRHLGSTFWHVNKFNDITQAYKVATGKAFQVNLYRRSR